MAIANGLGASARRVQQVLAASGLDCQVLEFPAGTRTAREAADSVGCDVGQIVKSLIFKGSHSGNAILVVASGRNRVNEKRLSRHIGEPVEKPDADFVRAKTGFVIGGVAPVGHSAPLPTYIDRDLLQYREIWAAAGTPHAVFKLTPQQLQTLTAGEVVDIL
jgi:prolyl-tRNA editing enzyme YbaK/EbsC (Cys-tRNA(Pro) deacylase)